MLPFFAVGVAPSVEIVTPGFTSMLCASTVKSPPFVAMSPLKITVSELNKSDTVTSESASSPYTESFPLNAGSSDAIVIVSLPSNPLTISSFVGLGKLMLSIFPSKIIRPEVPFRSVSWSASAVPSTVSSGVTFVIVIGSIPANATRCASSRKFPDCAPVAS